MVRVRCRIRWLMAPRHGPQPSFGVVTAGQDHLSCQVVPESKSHLLGGDGAAFGVEVLRHSHRQLRQQVVAPGRVVEGDLLAGGLVVAGRAACSCPVVRWRRGDLDVRLNDEAVWVMAATFGWMPNDSALAVAVGGDADSRIEA